MEFLIFLLIVVVFAIAALRWGYDSREDIHDLDCEHVKEFVLR